MTQEELALRSGVDQATVSRAISHCDATLGTLLRIAGGLDVRLLVRFEPFPGLFEEKPDAHSAAD